MTHTALDSFANIILHNIRNNSVGECRDRLATVRMKSGKEYHTNWQRIEGLLENLPTKVDDGCPCIGELILGFDVYYENDKQQEVCKVAYIDLLEIESIELL